jgi:hypothetical protein
MTPPVEYASTAVSNQRVVSTNGCDKEAAAELRRRGLAALCGTARSRDPHQLLKELERLKDGPDLRTPQEKVIATYARYRGRDPRMALLGRR